MKNYENFDRLFLQIYLDYDYEDVININNHLIQKEWLYDIKTGDKIPHTTHYVIFNEFDELVKRYDTLRQAKKYCYKRGG